MMRALHDVGGQPVTDKIPQTIQFFLPEGEPRGIRVADITTRIVEAVLVPRSKLPEAANRRELEKVGVYFLFGEPDVVIHGVAAGEGGKGSAMWVSGPTGLLGYVRCYTANWNLCQNAALM